MTKAQATIDQLPMHNVVTWTALISKCVQNGHGDEALAYYKQMQNEGFSPNTITYVSVLKACSIIGAIEKGKEIHAMIIKKEFLQKDIFLGTALMDMYCKCSVHASAQEVFHNLLFKDVVIWTALIAGYVDNKDNENALVCFNRMHCESLSPNAVTLNCILKACGSIRAINEGKKIHVSIVNDKLFQCNTLLSNVLVDFYVKCRSFAKAQKAFDELQPRDVVSWNVLISGNAQHGNGDEALDSFNQMQQECHLPNGVTFLSSLKACGSLESSKMVLELHVAILSVGLLEKDAFVGNALVDTYAKCGILSRAEEVFHQLSNRNVVTWNALLTGCAQHGRGHKLFEYFQMMKFEGISHNAITYLCLLKACGDAGELDIGEKIHLEIAKDGLLGKDDMVCNSLLDMYAKCGVLSKAREAFDDLRVHNVVSWTVLISGYSQHGHGMEALQLFEQMQQDGLCPNSFTCIFVLKACGSVGKFAKGKEMHCRISQQMSLENDILVGNVLVDMYAKCGALEKAEGVFSELKFRDVFSWNALIAGYLQKGYDAEALSCFDSMKLDGVPADMITFCFGLQACGNVGVLVKGQQIHNDLLMMDLSGNDIGIALADMYVKCGAHDEAQKVFSGFRVLDVFSWTVVIRGYTQHGHCEEALNSLHQMQHNDVAPDASTFICILKACADIGAINNGDRLHAEIVRKGHPKENILIGTALVDMYAKCGAIKKAHEVFNELPQKDIVCWTALIAGHALLGNNHVVIKLFSKMVAEKIEPNSVVFNVLLFSCSHSGLVDEGQLIFKIMSSVYRVVPCSEHYACVVDLFGRAGNLNMAIALIEHLPIVASLPVWTALLGACKKWENSELAMLAFENVLKLD